MGRLPPSKIAQLQKQAAAKQNKKSYRTKLLQQNKTVFKRSFKPPQNAPVSPSQSRTQSHNATIVDNQSTAVDTKSNVTTSKLTVNLRPNYSRSKKQSRRSNRSSHFKQLIEAATDDWKDEPPSSQTTVDDTHIESSKLQSSTNTIGYSFTTEGRRSLSKAITETKLAQKSKKQIRKQMNADINKFNAIFTSQSFQSDPVASVKKQINAKLGDKVNDSDTKEDNSGAAAGDATSTMVVDIDRQTKKRNRRNKRHSKSGTDNRWQRKKIDIFADDDSKWDDTKHILENDSKAKVNHSPISKLKRVEKRSFKTKSKQSKFTKPVKKRGNIFKTLSNSN